MILKSLLIVATPYACFHIWGGFGISSWSDTREFWKLDTSEKKEHFQKYILTFFGKINAYMNTYMQTNISTYINTYVRTHTCVHTCIHIRAFVCKYIYAYLHVPHVWFASHFTYTSNFKSCWLLCSYRTAICWHREYVWCVAKCCSYFSRICMISLRAYTHQDNVWFICHGSFMCRFVTRKSRRYPRIWVLSRRLRVVC